MSAIKRNKPKKVRMTSNQAHLSRKEEAEKVDATKTSADSEFKRETKTQQAAAENRSNPYGQANGSAQANGSSQSKSNGAKAPGASRTERLESEIEKARAMRVSELKQKLREMKIDTKAFFEKDDFVRAYAHAVVDGVQSAQRQEDYDPSYRDVVIQKFDQNSKQRYLLGESIIEVELQ